MSMLLGLESQVNFPREDLTDDNTALLELPQNQALLLENHRTAEMAVWPCSYTHPTAR